MAVISSKQPDSSNWADDVPDQIHLVLTPDEFATIVIALRAIELHGFADRLDAVLRQIAPAHLMRQSDES
jgi:hypothetical protein